MNTKLTAFDLLVIHDAVVSVKQCQGLGKYKSEVYRDKERLLTEILQEMQVSVHVINGDENGEDTH